MAHRGAAAEAPENTMEAFERALELGADGLELDVRVSADGAPVVVHDPDLDRTTTARGPVADRDARELEALGVPRLEDVLDVAGDLPVTVDVKVAAATADVVALLGRRERVERTVLYVEDGTELPAFRGYRGRRATSTRQALRLALLERWAPGRPPPSFPEVVHTPRWRFGVPVVTPGFVRAVHRSGRTVQVWTIDAPDAVRRLADWGVDAIVTNDVRAARRVLERRAAARGDWDQETGGTGATP